MHSFSDSRWGEDINFILFTPKLSPLGVGVMKFTSSCLINLQMLCTKLGQDWPSSSWKEDVYEGRMTDDRCQPIAISDSGDQGISPKTLTLKILHVTNESWALMFELWPQKSYRIIGAYCRNCYQIFKVYYFSTLQKQHCAKC